MPKSAVEVRAVRSGNSASRRELEEDPGRL